MRKNDSLINKRCLFSINDGAGNNTAHEGYIREYAIAAKYVKIDIEDYDAGWYDLDKIVLLEILPELANIRVDDKEGPCLANFL